MAPLHHTHLIVIIHAIFEKDEDISAFLRSRYGIVCSPEDVRNIILHGLGGGDTEDESIDLMEIVAILLIPTLLKYVTNINDVTTTNNNGQEELVQPPTDLIQIVMDKILEDVRCSLRFDDFWLLLYMHMRNDYFPSHENTCPGVIADVADDDLCLPAYMHFSLSLSLSLSLYLCFRFSSDDALRSILIRPPVILHQGS